MACLAKRRELAERSLLVELATIDQWKGHLPLATPNHASNSAVSWMDCMGRLGSPVLSLLSAIC